MMTGLVPLLLLMVAAAVVIVMVAGLPAGFGRGLGCDEWIELPV